MTDQQKREREERSKSILDHVPPTSANHGGFAARYIVRKADGSPIHPSRRYLVLDYSGADEEAVKALEYYAHLKLTINPQLANDLLEALANPVTAAPQHEG